jgi:hypothetical protein
MKLLGGLLLFVLVLTAGSAAAEDGISLAKVKRENRAQVRLQCFDECVSREIHYCKRVSRARARCAATVVFTMNGATSSCRVINRFKSEGDGIEIYSISTHCDPAKTAG